MSACAHKSLMSMLMKLPCARARGGVTRTTTLGQYAPWIWEVPEMKLGLFKKKITPPPPLREFFQNFSVFFKLTS